MSACGVAGFVPRVAQRAVQMETIVGLVAAGLGVALVPRPFETTGWAGVVFRSIGGIAAPVLYEVALAYRQNDDSPALAALLASTKAGCSSD
jgi:DNA-binding transcriptional LysR family regulator